MNLRCFKWLSLVLAFGLISCSNSQSSQNYSLLSDNPQMALVVNVFNMLHPSFKPILFSYRPNISSSDISQNTHQIIIAKNISYLSSYFKSSNLFIPFLSEPYQKLIPKILPKILNKKIIPLNFNVPIVLYHKNNNLPKAISLSFIENPQGEFYSSKPNSPQYLFFSPFINEKFLWYWSEINEIKWQKSFYNQLSWNEKNLQDFLDKVSLYYEKETYSQHQQFIQKYSYLGEANLILQDYNKFLFSDLNNWINYYLEGDPISFSFIKNQNKIVVMEQDITYMALPLLSSLDTTIKQFIGWITSEEGQISIIKNLKINSPYYYGFLNGFSFLSKINMSSIQNEFPYLLGKVPDISEIVITNPLPISRERLFENIFYPWIRKRFLYKINKPLKEEILNHKFYF